MMKRNLLSRTLLLLLMVVGGVCGAWADITSPWTYTFSKTSGGNEFSGYGDKGEETINGVTWRLDATWGSAGSVNPSADGTSGLKVGTNTKAPESMTFSTTGISGTITSIKITTNCRSKANSILTAKVGTTDFKCNNETSVNIAYNATTPPTYEFTGSASGEIVLSWAKNSSATQHGAFYITALTIEFQSADGSYSVTYDANGATSGTVPTDDTKYTDESNTVTVLGNTGSLTKDHYAFAGWNTSADGTGTQYAAGATFTITESTRLYAQWSANTNTVTLPSADTYGSYTMNATNPVAYGAEVVLTYTPASGYSSYVATWSLNGTEIDGNSFIMPDEAVTITVAVTEYIQPTSFTITLNNAFFGSEGTSNIENAELSGTDNKTTITIRRNQSADGGKMYVNASQIRLYNHNTMTVTAPLGYMLTSIEFVEPSSGKAWAGTHTSSPAGYDGDTKTWTGEAEEVVITFGGTCRMAALNITLVKIEEIEITVSKEYISYCSPYALDFTNVKGLEALVVTKINDTSVSTEKVETVPAGVGVILHKDPNGEATSFNVPVVATATKPAKNFLVGVLEATTIGGNDTKDYVLKDGKFMKASLGTLAAGKAYLKTDANAAPALTIGFGDEGTTGIRSIDNGQLTIDNVYYDLSGRRVAEPTKGVYIVNGKKVVIK